MKYLIKQRIEMFKKNLSVLKKLPPDEKTKSVIQVNEILIKEFQTSIDEYAKSLHDLSKGRANLGKLQMQNLGDLIQDHIKGLGFVLFVFPFHNSGISNYISNGQRKDIINLLKETLERFENDQIYDTHETN